MNRYVLICSVKRSYCYEYIEIICFSYFCLPEKKKKKFLLFDDFWRDKITEKYHEIVFWL